MNTIARPSASAAAMTSASFTLPPGCATAVTPALRRGLDAVREREERVGSEHASPRLLARLLARDLHGDDARHLPGADADGPLAAARTMAFDFTCLQTRHANSSAAQLLRRSGARFVTTLPRVDLAGGRRVAVLHDEAAADALAT